MSHRRRGGRGSLEVCLLAAGLGAGCTVQRPEPNLKGQDVRLTVIHTADIHSRLFPYHFVPGKIDEDYGLVASQGPYGGIARIGAMVKDIRAHAARSLWLDSGDSFQGAPVFNIFRGEVEYRALSHLGLDAAVVGNHEFDLGANNLYEQALSWARFPLLAANYYFEDPREPNLPKLRELILPYQMFDVDGLRVSVIGMGNVDTITSLEEGGNALGARGLDANEVMRKYVALLRPVSDLVVVVSHLGLDQDEGLAPDQVADENAALPLEGVDLILGGHLHIVLNPPKALATDRFGHPTVLVHSGAFAKYVGRLDLVVHVGEDASDPAQRSYITAFTYDNLPVACGAKDANGSCSNPSDPGTLALLQPYDFVLHQQLDLDGVFAYVNATGKIVRADPSGGDSQLGNLVARSMQVQPGVDADFAFTNSLGIRSDFEQGPLTLEDLYNVFPFENTITLMFLSGSEIQETLDFVAQKSNERGCRSQIQQAGLWWTMVCGQSPHAEDVYLGERCRKPDGTIDTDRCRPIVPLGLYRVAVNDYIAAGGSGFTVLKRNPSKLNTGVSLRLGLKQYLRQLAACPAEQVDMSDAQGRTVLSKYGTVTCIDDEVEAHEDRIAIRFQ
jgi:5'-nucleotidase / UDP-sugar diphosphatase